MNKWIEINTKIIYSNIKKIKSTLNKNVKLMAVVKANAYGHGLIEVSKIAINAGADLIGVLDLKEALELKQNKINSKIMILSPLNKEDLNEIIKNDFIPTIDNIEILKLLNKKNKKINFNLDMDFGLKRWGININDFNFFLKEIQKLKNLNFYSLSTHIAYTPYKNMIEAEEKLKKFKELSLKAKKIFPDLISHCANSSVLSDFKNYQLDMVRIGNLIYGIYPAEIYHKKLKGPPIKGLKRPWKFFAKIISIKDVKEGESFGYASEIIANKNMRVGTILVGYSDGLTLEPKENTYKISQGTQYWANINDKKAFFLSKSSISHTLIDLTDIKEARIGTKVSLAIRRTATNSKILKIYK